MAPKGKQGQDDALLPCPTPAQPWSHLYWSFFVFFLRELMHVCVHTRAHRDAYALLKQPEMAVHHTYDAFANSIPRPLCAAGTRRNLVVSSRGEDTLGTWQVLSHVYTQGHT